MELTPTERTWLEAALPVLRYAREQRIRTGALLAPPAPDLGHPLPAGLRVVPLGAHLSPDHADLLSDMWRTRREEAYADLVGLAWTLQHHPTRYAELHDWHVCFRAEQAVATGPHDTRLWVHLAGDTTRFLPAATTFEQVEDLWRAGLLADD